MIIPNIAVGRIILGMTLANTSVLYRRLDKIADLWRGY
jgi:hypothetical protein